MTELSPINVVPHFMRLHVGGPGKRLLALLAGEVG